MITLYPHQEAFVADLRQSLSQQQAVIGQAATGFGKTVTGAFIAQSAAAKGKRVVFSVHRKNLLRQTAATFDQFKIPYSYIAAGQPHDAGQSVYVASIGTLGRRLDTIPAPDLLVIDEAHLAAAKTWRKVVAYYKERGARILGLSATPCRLDSKPLSDLFDHMVSGPSVRWLMDNGYLSDYIAYAPSSPDLSGVRSQMGDHQKSALEGVMDKPHLTGDAAKHYRALAYGTLAICYCVSIKHSMHVAEHFNAAGIPAAHIDGNTPQLEQYNKIKALANREILVLCNVDLITTGFDLGSQVGRDIAIETIICLRPTKSLALHRQMIGRGLRKKNNPAIILDHAGNLTNPALGLPDDEVDWTLDSKAKLKGKQKDDDGLVIRRCPNCYAAHKPAPICPNCGFEYPVKSREIEEVDGSLERIDPAVLRRRLNQEQGKARTLDELRKIGRERGHKPGWAYFVYKTRKRKTA